MSEFVFESDAPGAGSLHVAEIRGNEGLSQPFEYEVKLVSPRRGGAVIKDLHALLYQPASLEFARRLELAGGGSGKVRERRTGMLKSFQMLDADEDWIVYQAVLVPSLWKLSLTHRSRVFCFGEQPKTIQEILTGVLKEHGFSEGTDFEFKPFANEKLHPKRGYVVQYEETDFDFLSRWLEHEGIYYYFENKDGQEKVIFADSTGGYRPLSGKKVFRYSAPGPESDTSAFGTLNAEEIVRSYTTEVTPIPRRLILNDHNWRTPDTPLAVLEKVGERDDLAYAGTFSEYNYHYKDVDQGKALAQVRAEEFRCRQQLFHGESSGRAFRPGHVFELTDYFHSDYNRAFLLTQVSVRGSQTVALDGSGAAGSAGVYGNAFTAIPDDVTFRPPAVTDWPTIHGVIHGEIDGELDDHPYSQVDPEGLYKLKLPFDNQIIDEELPTPADGKCSRPTRMAQPFADASDGAGFHFPLHKGTEVVVYHMDGDPDRPIIAGAVPNALHTSPVGDGVGGGQQWNRITSTSGNTTVFDDSTDSPGVLSYNANTTSVTDNRDHTTGGGGGPTGFQLFTGQASGGGSGGGGGGAVGRGRQPGPGLGMGDAELESTWAGGGAQDHDSDGKAGEHRLQTGTDANGNPIYDTSVTGSNSSDDTEGRWEGYIDDLVSERNTGVAKNDESGDVSGSDVVGYTFTGDMRNALRIWSRDTYTILDGHAACTYNNVSNSINFDTGGYSYSKSDGNEENHSIKLGNVESHSDTTGNTTSYSTLNGNSDSQSSVFGYDNGASLTIGRIDKASCQLSGEAYASFTLSGVAKAEISIGGEVSFGLEVAVKAGVSIAIGGEFNVKICAAGEYNINIPKKDNVELSKSECILTYKGIFLERMETSMKLTITALECTDMIGKYTYVSLKDDNATMSENKAALEAKKAALSEKGNFLDKMDNALSDKCNALSRSDKALSIDQKGAIVTIG